MLSVGQSETVGSGTTPWATITVESVSVTTQPTQSYGSANSSDALSDSQSNQDITATLGAGETSSGWIAYDVPHPHGYIVYAPNANGQPLAEWKY
jgi:hypothetical protein